MLLKHLQALEAEADGVRSGSQDIEYIHRARVASRRLRAALPLFEDCLPAKKAKPWLRQMRKVTHALGEARDTDVQIERVQQFSQALSERRYQPGVQRLLLRLRQRREQLQRPTVRAMARLLEKELPAQMRARLEPLAGQEDAVYTPVLYQHSAQAIHRRLADFLAFEGIVYQPEKIEELHQMRIAAKWLRYTLETFAPLYSNQLKPFLQPIRKMQDLLGEIHDNDVWASFLPRFVAEERQRTCVYFGSERPMNRLLPGLRHFQTACEQARAGLYQCFLQAWRQSQEEQLWERLRQTIQAPVFQPDTLYPPPPADPPAA